MYIFYLICIRHTQTERQTDRKTGRQTERQADRKTGRQTGRQTDRQTDRLLHIPLFLNNEEFGARKCFTGYRTANAIQLFVAIKRHFTGLFFF